jgi:hypothetical protein
MFTEKPPFGLQIQVRQTMNRPKRRLSIFHFLLKEAALGEAAGGDEWAEFSAAAAGAAVYAE